MDETEQQPTLAELEIAARTKAEQNHQLLMIEDILLDSNVSETDKNAAVLLGACKLYSDYLKSAEAKETSNYWEKVQRPIMAELCFEGCEIKTYSIELDGLNGCYLEYNASPYKVLIDVEDRTSMEEVIEDGYLSVEIWKLPDDIGDDETELFEGCVRTITDAQILCKLTKDGKIDAAVGMLRRYSDLFPSPMETTDPFAID